MAKEIFEEKDILKIKNPSYPYQHHLRYKVIKLRSKNRVDIEETVDKFIYKNQSTKHLTKAMK